MALRIAACVFNIAVSLGIPLGVLVYLILRRRQHLLPFAVGALTFLVSQLLTRVPLLGVLGGMPWFIAFSKSTVPYALFLGLTAGLFEEAGRYIAMRLMRRHRGYGAALSFGLGHGGLEAGAVVGLNNLFLLFTAAGQLAAYSWFYISLAGFERLFAMMAHVGFSVLVMQSVQRRRPLLLVVAIGLHALLDTGAVLLGQVTSIYVVEGFAALFGLAMLLYTLRARPAAPPAGQPEITGGTP